MNVLFKGLAAGGMVLGLGIATAQAITLTYTDRATFQAAAGNTISTETFSGSTVGLFPSTYSQAFSTFTVSGTTNGNRVGIATNTIANSGDNTPIPSSFVGQNFFGWGNQAGGVIGAITFTFSKPVASFGFDWFNTDQTDQYQIALSDGSVYYAPPFTYAGSTTASTGFYGLTSTTLFTSFQITDQSQGGYISTEGLDNLTTSTNVAPVLVPVPEPTSLALLAVGTLGIVARRRRAN